LIPVKLALKNFLSYGENVPPLDFTQFHLACLSGNNGQGKSALLDALTWAVWGEGRKSSQEKKADHSLLRIGQKDMQVEFIFDLEGDRYRIIRNYSMLQKSSRSSLEFQIYNPKDDKYISLTAPSIRKTQERITKTLRIDYRTFINSAFILQGRIDEFSRKNARERKEILSEILSLSHYDELANLAKSHLKEINNIMMTKESRLEYIYQEMTNIDAYKQKIKELSDSYEDISQKVKKNEDQLNQLKEDINLLKHKKEQFEELKDRTEQQRQEIGRGQKQIELKNKEIADSKKIISQKEIILSNFINYQKFNTENNELTLKLQKIRKIEEERILTERKIESGKTDLTVEIRNKRDRFRDLQLKAERELKSKTEVLEAEKKMREIKFFEEESEEIRKKGSEFNIAINTIKGQLERLEKDHRDNEEKLRLLRENPEGECPLCEAKLNAERKKKIETNLSREINLNLKEIERLKKEEERLGKPREELVKKWREINQKLKNSLKN